MKLILILSIMLAFGACSKDGTSSQASGTKSCLITDIKNGGVPAICATVPEDSDAAECYSTASNLTAEWVGACPDGYKVKCEQPDGSIKYYKEGLTQDVCNR